MVSKAYAWETGAVLDEHSKRKHKVLEEYLTEYLTVRCQHPNQERFRIAIIDGFCGAGRYGCGSPGSPIIFVEALEKTVSSINLGRAAQGLKPIQVDVLLILNDATPGVIDLCKENLAPILAAAKDAQDKLSVEVRYFEDEFEKAYPEIKDEIQRRGFSNSVFFNLDQCGHGQVEMRTISDILSSYPSPEILLTFAIEALVTFLPRSDQEELARRLRHFGVEFSGVEDLATCMANSAWLGVAERTVFESFGRFGAFTSPFSIHNPKGWRYWLLHFAKSYRARQVYNDILHRNSSAQAHFGRSGLNMLSYDPQAEGKLYLFEQDDRQRALEQLREDIPRSIANGGDAVEVGEFYRGIYNLTPAHSDDIHQAIIENPDISVVTPNGGERRVANTIRTSDVLKLRPQRNFFSILFGEGTSGETEQSDDS